MSDTIDRQAAIDAVYKCDDIFVGDMPVMVVKADAYEALAQLPSAQPDSKELSFTQKKLDTISRQAAIDIVQGYAERLQGYIGMPNDSEVYAYARGLLLSIDRSIKALPSAQPDSKELSFTHKALDTISRQDAIRIVDGIDTWQAGWRGDAIESMKALPPAQPETHEERTETHSCDLIERQAAIDAHYEYCNKHPDASFPVWSLKILEDLPPSQPDLSGYSDKLWKAAYERGKTEVQQRWIPCSERLPEANGRYIVTRGLNACGAMWNRVYIANYSNLMGLKSVKIWWQGNVGKSDFERLDDVLAWMPLPEPYREEGD